MINRALNKETCKTKKALLAIILGIFAAIFILNCFTVFVADDFSYSTSTSFIRTFIDEAHFYQIMNGRTLTHIIARNFLRLPKIIFNLANSLVYVSLTLLVYLYANSNSKKEFNFHLYLFINACIWLFVPHFGQSILWITGSCNYLWGTTIIFAFLLPSYLHAQNQFDFKHNYLAIIGMFLAGVAAGWCSENTSGGCILFLLILIAYCKHQKIKIRPWMVSALVGLLSGYTIMLASPGNRTRMDYFPQKNPLIVEIVERFTKVTSAVHESMMFLLCLWIVLMIILICCKKDKVHLFFSCAFTITAAASIYALILTPTAHGWGRAMFGGTLFMITGTAYAFAHIDIAHAKFKAVAFSMIAILLFQTIFLYYFAVYDLMYSKINSDKRDAYVQEQKILGNVNPTISSLPKAQTSYNPRYKLSDIQSDQDNKHWVNHAYVIWAGIDSIRSVSNEDWENIYRYGDPTLMNCQVPEEYLKLINNDKYTLFLSVHQDASLIGEKLTNSLEQLGIKKDWQSLNTLSYLAVIDSGRVIYEDSAERRLTYETTLDDLHIQMKSKGSYLDDTALASIVINDFDYARNQKGMNIAVYDQEQNKVVDSVVIQYDQKEDDLVLRR